MRILLDCKVNTPDGIGRFVRNLTNSLHKEVSKSSSLLSIFANDVRLADLCDDVFVEKSQHYTLDELRNKAVAIEVTNADIIHCTDYRTSFEAINVPLVVSIHDIFRFTSPELCYSDSVFIEKYSQYAFDQIVGIVTSIDIPFELKKNFQLKRTDSVHFIYYASVLYRALSTANCIIVPTNTVKTEILKNFDIKTRIEVIPYGINHSDLDSSEVSESIIDSLPDRFLAYVGQYRAHKQIDLLFEAFVEILKTDPDLKLVLIGKDFNGNEQLRLKLEGLRISGSVNVLGYVNDSTLKVCYQKCLALVHLAQYEGYGFTPLEALSQGALVIASEENITLHETMAEHCFFINTESSDTVAERISKGLIELKPDDELVRQKRKDFVKDLTWQNYAKRALQIYSGLIS